MKRSNLWKMSILILLPLLLPAQIENWVYVYNGSQNASDNAAAIVYGADGNLYAAGCNVALWDDPEFTVISLMPTGHTNWVYEYSGPWGYDAATSAVYGKDGNIYVTGVSFNWGYACDLVAIKLSAYGWANWVYRYYGNPSTGAAAIAYGDDDNIYVAGGEELGLYHSYFLVISLAANGDTNWIYRYGGPGNYRNCAFSIVYGCDGNVYAAGNGTSSDTTSDFLVISLTTTGDTNWVYTYNGPINSDDAAQCIVYGADSNIYVAGYSAGSGTGNDIIVISLTSFGDTNWVYRYNGPGNGGDGANSIVYGADGNIYVAGGSTAGSFDFTVISLTTAGNTNWVYTHNGPGGGGDCANSIVYGADSNIYAAGSSTGYGTALDFTVISLSPGTGVDEGEHMTCSDHEFITTIFSGPLLLPEGKKYKVFDIAGRLVEPDKIQPGIYFIEVDGVVTQKVVKVR